MTPWQIWIDTGGTFTDCLARDPGGTLHRAKVLSSSALRGLIVQKLDPRRLHVREQWNAPGDFIRSFGFRLLSDDPQGAASPQAGAPSAIVESYDPVKGVIELAEPLSSNILPGTAFEVVSPEEAPVLAARLVTQTLPGAPLPPLEMRLATTRGTNALLERRGAKTVLLITRGFGDLLEIGDQQRPDLFALEVRKPLPLYSAVIEVEERLAAEGSVLCPLRYSAVDDGSATEGLEDLRRQIQDLRSRGIQAAAIALMHSFRNPQHERELASALKDCGMEFISSSADLAPSIRLLPRAETAVVDAYLAPVIQEYLQGVRRSLGSDSPAGKPGQTLHSLHIMTSAGGLAAASAFRAKDSLLSGPAGGVVGAVLAARRSGIERAILFDMGGTSTDVARFDGDFQYVFEYRVGDARLASPALAIETVAAGGGSICFFDGHTLRVGPRSAGARPGPACYGAGGPLTLTDVHLLLGRLDPTWFEIPIQPEAASAAFAALRREVEVISGETASEALLEGCLEIADERMADAIRTISMRQGCDPAEYSLVAFGGAGGQHACRVAGFLGIRSILSPADSGLLSALGVGHARIERFAERQVLRLLDEAQGDLADWIADLGREASLAVQSEGIPEEEIEISRCILQLRLLGQDSSLAVEFQSDRPPAEAFAAAYVAIFGYPPEGKPVELEAIRVVAHSRSRSIPDSPSNADVDSRGAGSKMPGRDGGDASNPDAGSAETVPTRRAFCKGEWREMHVYHRARLRAGTRLEGPCVVLDRHSTVIVEPGWSGEMDAGGALLLETQSRSGDPEPAADMQIRGDKAAGAMIALRTPAQRPAAVELELFTQRFRALVGEMGEMLRRTAISTNVKERLDFSCALLNPEGELLANAPHIPVHLGALGLCVRRVREALHLGPGDAAVTNHPAFGGSHLPDITVITPVFFAPDHSKEERGQSQKWYAGQADFCLLGYVASRAHHAEIGGSRPGSLPPAATRLIEEGIVISPRHLVQSGAPRWEEMAALLASGPYPSRAPADNLADLRAAIAANHRGAAMLIKLAAEHGVEAVIRQMNALKQRAARQVHQALLRRGDGVWEASECLDDGSPLRVKIAISGGRAVIDFEGSAGVHPGNLNATPAIVRSAVLYVLRLMIEEDLPLNEGLLQAVELRIPAGILNPDFGEDPNLAPAVVGGNVETSQRLVDTLIKALGLAACSQGSMNSVVFGNAQSGYYETVCGGCGAGPGFDGASAVHSHMTNTRITDPEILEHRYPVRVERFEIRKGSGGAGKWRGGDGVIRELTFLAPLSLSILSQHRIEAPYGMAGGDPGARGRQRVIRASGEVMTLASIDGCEMQPGDKLLLETPGGGGWGCAAKNRTRYGRSNVP